MKKYIIALVIVGTVFLASCGASRVADLRSLAIGMTKSEVVQAIGLADRTLAINDTKEGLQEILEFRTYYNEVYAVEFINDRMVGYEFLYEDSPTIVTGTVIPMYPIGPYRPIYHVQPNRPTIPNRPSKPNRPTTPSRPSRPVETGRPSTGSISTRPTTPSETTTTRPSTREVNDLK